MSALPLPGALASARQWLRAYRGAALRFGRAFARGDVNAIAQFTQRRDGKEFVALPREKLAELRHLVDEQVASLEPGAALVVRPRGLRRFVRRVVEVDHPDVAVLAFTELSPDVQLKVKESLPAPTPTEAVA